MHESVLAHLATSCTVDPLYSVKSGPDTLEMSGLMNK